MSKRKEGIPRLLEVAGKKKGWLIASAILAVISSIAQFVPLVTVYKIIVELARNTHNFSNIDQEYIWQWCYYAAWSFVIFAVSLIASLILSHIAAFNILYEFRIMLSNKLARLPLGFFSVKTSGEVKKVMGEDVERLELFIAHYIPDIISAIIFPSLIIIYMFIIDWRLAISALLIFIISIIIVSRMNSVWMRKIADEYLQTLGRMNSGIVEFIKGIQVVKVFTRSSAAFEHLNKSIDDYQNFALKITRKWAGPYLGFSTVLGSVTLFLILIGVFFLQTETSYSSYLPVVLMFIILGGGMFFPMLKLMHIGGIISQINVGVKEIDKILYMDEIPQHSICRRPDNYNVDFRNVSFSYDKTEVLTDITFSAKEGSVTALVGPSGGGKTTIAMLLARFWDVDSGRILIGDIPINDIKTSDLMHILSFVFQDNMLFYDTIEENIRMGNINATDDEVTAAAKAAQCHEFIKELKDEYKTFAGDGGTHLSGGEQQRIALARVILKDSPIIILDEATAYADPENERKILEAFSHLIKDKTVFVIAHRLNTIVNADQILYIDEKQIKERGTHQQLIEQGKQYSKMWAAYSQAQEWVIDNKEGEIQ